MSNKAYLEVLNRWRDVRHCGDCHQNRLFYVEVRSNKNQHFVPRCYLKAFTRDEGNATIKIFNIDRRKFIPTAPVKNQCSGSYFYGDDPKLEEAIQSCEGQDTFSIKTTRASFAICKSASQNPRAQADLIRCKRCARHTTKYQRPRAVK
ncbi:DUF4238 domain-containing protein [Paraburkholderia kirstenboschensis]|uniref:DUF4238 domain-containing protein n=1 Tax=Paraburkholderia kirstenboschensis TaxID=1245436 RepID=UPI0037428F1D